MDTIGVLILVALGIFAVFIFWLVWWWHPRGEEYFRERRSAGWPVVPAIVENYEIELSRHQGFTTVLYYSYSVNGESYSGQFNQYWQGTEGRARDTGDQWTHKKILVRHKPTDPSQSVYIEKDSQMSAAARAS